MRIIPVIDILDSVVVHAVAGERNRYLPLTSVLYKGELTPNKLVEVYIEQLGVNEIYIADLDSIINKKPNIETIKKIIDDNNIHIILDPGIRSQTDLYTYSEIGLKKLILGTETINNLEIVEKSLEIYQQDEIIVSVDMKSSKILTDCQDLKDLTPLQTVQTLQKIGVSEVILLDLARVGKKIGNIPESFIKIQENTEISILIGGGIKTINDIFEIEKQNFSGVLLATALHQGLINAHEVREYLKGSKN